MRKRESVRKRERERERRREGRRERKKGTEVSRYKNNYGKIDD